MSVNAESMNAVLGEPEAPMFVINLCASTTPVALVQPNSPELKRYTFFVTRRREDGRERFRLHMGYFDAQAEAEALLADVREVYPAAWVGPAPGHRPAPRVAPVPAPAKPAVAVATEASKPVNAVATGATKPAIAVAAESAKPAVAVAAEAPMELSLVDDVPREPLHKTSGAPRSEPMSNVREVLAALDDRVATPAASAIPVVAAPPGPVELKPAQALTLLEEGVVQPDLADTAVRMITPEDTQTLRDIKLDIQNKAPPCFAVQLVWSVTPIDTNKLPQLAIFGAYTLYHVEGNRQGRRWYGVRLGFFTDSHAAKQVAYYMKADYSSVVVVPVTVKERDRASGDGEAKVAKPALVVAKAASAKKPGIEGFELLADDAAAATKRAAPAEIAPSASPEKKAELANIAAPTGSKVNFPDGFAPHDAKPRATKKPTGKRVVVRVPARPAEPGQPAPLEETLEMLGASTLTLDENRAQIDDSGLRRRDDKPKQKSGMRLSRLLGRLSEKLGDSRR